MSTAHLHALTCRTYDHIYLCLYIIALFGNILKKSAFGHADVGVTFLTCDVYIRVILSMEMSLRKLTSIERWCSTISGNTSFRVFFASIQEPTPLEEALQALHEEFVKWFASSLGKSSGFILRRESKSSIHDGYFRITESQTQRFIGQNENTPEN